MSQFAPAALLETDPLLKQSIESLGMPEPLALRIPKTLIGNIIAGGLVAASVVGVYEAHSSDVVDAAFDNRVPAGQTDCVYVGNPGDVALTNSTIVEPTQPGFATVGPSGYDWRAYSTNNYGVGGASPNLTATEIGPDGKLCTTAQQSAHKLLDIVTFIDGDVVTPYQGSPTPIRIMDTRSGPKPAAGQTDCVYVGNPGDVALTNSTIVEPTQPGFATVGPSGYDWRAYSTNNYGVGGASPNLTATEIGPDGKLCTTAQQSAHKLLDIVTFIDGDVVTPYQGSPTPIRIMDTRSGPKPAAGQTDCVYVGNPGDVALTNSTIVEPTQPGFATVGPSGYDWRAYSTNNYGVGGASPNLTATEIGPDGKLCTTAQQSAHKLLDIVTFIDGDVVTPYQGSPTPIRIMDTRQNVSYDINGLTMISSYGSNYVTDNQISTTCYSQQPYPGYFFREVTYDVSGLLGNPALGASGGIVKFNYIPLTGGISFGGPYYPDVNGKIRIKFAANGTSQLDASKWKGKSTFSIYNTSNPSSPITDVPTSIFDTDIDCPLR